MKWVDFSFFKVELLLRITDAGNFFVVRPLDEVINPKVVNAFTSSSYGFSQEAGGQLVAHESQALLEKLMRAKNTRQIYVDRRAILDKQRMRWVDFSAFNVKLLFRMTDDVNYFVAEPINGRISPQVRGAFSTYGFINEGNDRLIAVATKALSEKLKKTKNTKEIEVYRSDILDKTTPLPEAIDTPLVSLENDVSVNDKIGDRNEHSRNEGGGAVALGTVLPEPLPGENRNDRGAGGGSPIDSNRDGSTEASRIVGSGSMASGEGDILDNKAERQSSDQLDFTLPDADRVTYGERLKNNLASIRLLKQLKNDGAQATPDEKILLSHFSGWGALKNVFNPTSKSKQDTHAFSELSTLLTKDELYWARNGVLGQHFTSKEVINGIYSVLNHAGFSGGNIIEPALGVGHFIGQMPEKMRANSHWYGVEIDPVPGDIAKQLYPSATILSGTGFQVAEFQYNKFDLAIGNPPFGDERISDNNESRSAIDRFKIHNYIIAKSSMHLKDDGLLAMIVTHRFLDSNDSEARDFLAKNLDLLAAIRLPNTAFEGAGTEVTTDIIFLKKRSPELLPGDQSWLKSDGVLLIDGVESELRINQYFVENPEMMLGTPSDKGRMYGAVEGKQFTLNPHADLSIQAQIDGLLLTKLSYLKDSLKSAESLKTITLNRTDIAVGGYSLEDDGSILMREQDVSGNAQFSILEPGMRWTEKTDLGEKRYSRISGMLHIRKMAYELIDAERRDLLNIESIRTELNGLYDGFVNEFGYINDPANASLIDGDVKIEFGLEKGYKSAVSKAKAGKRGGEATNSFAEKADILLQRVFFPYQDPLFAKNVEDGYSISMSEKGRLDVDYIQSLTGLSFDEVIDGLSVRELPLIFKDPLTDEWIQEDKYLSGNVKRKLREAMMAGDAYQANVYALEKVQPKDIAVEEIFIDIGQTWIPRQVYEQFLVELGLKTPVVSISDFLGTVTVVKHGDFLPSRFSDALINKNIAIYDMFNSVANKRSIVIWRGEGKDKRIDQEATSDANLVAKKMGLTFRDWALADDSRKVLLANVYNETQNTTIERRYAGEHLKMVGAIPSIMMRDTQKNAAWRMIQSDATLLDHLVGAGKTFTIIAGVMERKRLGLSKKSVLVVPNHLVTQWSIDFLTLYPGANILAASEKDFSKPNRRRLFANIATSDYDAVIIGHSSLKFIPLSHTQEAAFLRNETNELINAINSADANDDKRGVRTLQNRLAKRREKLVSLSKAPKDDVVTFEDMGIDYLAIDECHEFKNLEYASGIKRVAGMGNPEGSQKAFDLYMKLKYIKLIDGGVTFATGTPVSNSLVEMYAIMRYLNGDGLEERKLSSFDAWVKTYALIENKIEYTATQQLKERAVMSNFNNIPEMMQLYKEFGDVVTMSDLKSAYTTQIQRHNQLAGANLSEDFPIPKINGGGRVLDVAPPNADQKEYMDYLIERALKIERDHKQKKFNPKIDNLLWVYSDAKKAALDIRIVDPLADDTDYNKTSRAAKDIYSRYLKWNDDKGTQLVFCDLSTPSKTAKKNADKLIKELLFRLKIEPDSPEYLEMNSMSYQEKWSFLKTLIEYECSGDINDARRDLLDTLTFNTDCEIGALITADTGFSVYDDLKKKLIALGIPINEIQFIHDYESAKDKKGLFDQVNAGNVRVLMGSTAKMGAGTNAQRRLVGATHIDSSQHNRPSDIEQREGRIIRQGNLLYERDPLNFRVDIIAYSTAQTFDTVAWQTLARKAEMLEGFRSGLRTIEEKSSDSASYMEFMAETTGNPIFKEKIKLEGEIIELESDERRIRAQLSSANHLVSNDEYKTNELTRRIAHRVSATELISEANTYSFRGKHYQRDKDVITQEEKALYEKEMLDYPNKLLEHKVIREQWELLEKSERGPAPKNPVSPESPTFNSSRMDRSEEVLFLREIRSIMADPEGLSRISFYAGNLQFEIQKHYGHKSLVSFDIQDELNIILCNNFSRVGITSLVSRINECSQPTLFSEDIGKIEKALANHAIAISAAKEFISNVDFHKADELQAKRDRHKEIYVIVSEIEEQESIRRLSSGNRYMERDVRRFGNRDGSPTHSSVELN